MVRDARVFGIRFRVAELPTRPKCALHYRPRAQVLTDVIVRGYYGRSVEKARLGFD